MTSIMIGHKLVDRCKSTAFAQTNNARRRGFKDTYSKAVYHRHKL